MLQVAGGPQRGVDRMSRVPVCAPSVTELQLDTLVWMAEVTCKDKCCCSLGPWEDWGTE